MKATTCEVRSNRIRRVENGGYTDIFKKEAEAELEKYKDEVKKFKQICPKEMLDKLSNPLSLKTKILKAV